LRDRKRDDRDELIDGDLRCATVIRHEKAWESVQTAPSEAPVPAGPQLAVERRSEMPGTSDEALRLAIKLAVDAGEYDRAAALLDVARRTAPKAASVTPLAAARERGRS
jgi:hypothetical protein